MLDTIATPQQENTPEAIQTQFALEMRLYKKHSNGSIGDYLITVTDNEDGTAMLTRAATKVIGGKANITLTPINEGKNIGRANETTAVEQAIKEAQSKIKGQLKKGYVTCIEDTDKDVTNQNGDPLPMLAKKFQEVKSIPNIVSVQRKLNGHRLLAIIKDGIVHLYSREGTTVNMPHISNELQTAYDTGAWDGKPIDGELFKFGWSLEKISKMVKKLRQESTELKYHIYDTIDPEKGFIERSSIIQKLFEQLVDVDNLVQVETFSVTSEEDIHKLDEQFVREGHEGTIIRLHGEGYKGGRTGQLIKLKRYLDDEFTIIGHKLGKPTIDGDNVYQTPVWLLENKSGEHFYCTAQGNTLQKHALYEQGLESFYGRLLNVRYWELSDRGVPPNSVAMYFKDTL